MVFVITGGPGFGKTTIINKLAELGFPVGVETARFLLSGVNSQVRTRAGLPANFEKEVANARLDFMVSNQSNAIAFSDRGLPDQIAYSLYKRMIPSNFIEELVSANSYAPTVFVTPPWKSIYVQDEIRTETFEEAVEIHRQILDVYSRFSYKIINLPLANPEERVRFILNFLGI